MRGAVLYGPRDVRFEAREIPTITKPTDAVIRIAATCVCGSDLWPYRGLQATNGPTPMGHEYCGIATNRLKHEMAAGFQSHRCSQFYSDRRAKNPISIGTTATSQNMPCAWHLHGRLAPLQVLSSSTIYHPVLRSSVGNRVGRVESSHA